MTNYKRFVNNKTKGRSPASPSVCIEWYEGAYYVNGKACYTDLEEALKLASKRLPTAPVVAIYIRPSVVYMHVRKPSKLYDQVSERMSPKDAWPLFEAHAGMMT